MQNICVRKEIKAEKRSISSLKKYRPGYMNV